jgi:TPR repeat protein
VRPIGRYRVESWCSRRGRQYAIEANDAPLWHLSWRSLPKDIDLLRLKTAFEQVIIGNTSASLDYLWDEARREVPFAQTVIAGLLRAGTGIEPNIDRAAFWALRAAYGGYPSAMELVGDIYDAGSWVVKNQRLAAA